MRVALITGVTGQDGAYLAEFLPRVGYVVHRLRRSSSLFNADPIDHLNQDQHESNLNFIIRSDYRYFAKTEVALLLGYSTKSKTKQGCQPTYDLPTSINVIFTSDLHSIKKNKYINQEGFKTLNYFE